MGQPLPAPLLDARVERLERRFTFAEVRPSPEAVASAVGYPAGEVPEVLQDALAQVTATGEALWSIQGGCFLLPEVAADKAAHQLRAGGRSFRTGKIVTGQMSRATALGVFLCTAGKGIEDLSRALLAAGDPFTGYVANSLGSLVVEAAMDRLQDAFGAWMTERGLHVTNRYSPGYCGWHVSEQQHLFQLLPAGYCGVRLTESSLMQPVKSVSGFIGVGKRVRYSDYTCNVCEMDACIYRETRSRRAAAAARGPHGAGKGPAAHALDHAGEDAGPGHRSPGEDTHG